MKYRPILWILIITLSLVTAAGIKPSTSAMAESQDEDSGSESDDTNYIYLPRVIDTLPTTDWIGPDGGKIVSLTIYNQDSSVMYAGTWGSGVFKSTDSGATWTPVNDGLDTLYIQSIAVSPNDRNRVYAGTYKDGIYMSTDGGETWEDQNDDIQDDAVVYSIAIDKSYPNRVYIATRGDSESDSWNGVIYRSTDYGVNWKESLTGISDDDKISGKEDDYAYSLSVDPDDSDRIYAALHALGPWMNEDHGNTDDWDSVYDDDNDKPSMLGRYIVAVEGDDHVFYGAWTDSDYDETGGVWYSDDEADSWDDRYDDIDGTDVAGIAVDPDSDKILYAATLEDGLFKSTDRGNNWSELYQGFNFDEELYNIEMDPTDNTVLFTGTNGDGLYKSTDSGATWDYSQSGLTGSPITGMVYNADYPNVLMASMYEGGMFVSTDYGDTWSNVTSSKLIFKDIHGLVSNPDDPTQVFILTNSNGLYTYTLPSVSDSASSEEQETAIAESAASGFSEIGDGLPTQLITDATYGDAYTFGSGHPFAGQTMSEDEKLDLAETSDASASSDAPDDTALLCMAFSPTESGRAYLGTEEDGVYMSYDDGDNWSQVGLSDYEIYAVAVDYSSIVYAGTSSSRSLRYSTDGGDSWAKSSLTEDAIVYSISISAADESTMYVGTSDGLYTSTSGSNVYEQIAFDGLSVNTVQASPLYEGVVIAGTNSGAYISQDGGETWTEYTDVSGNPVQTITYDYGTDTAVDHYYIGTQTHGIYRIEQVR